MEAELRDGGRAAGWEQPAKLWCGPASSGHAPELGEESRTQDKLKQPPTRCKNAQKTIVHEKKIAKPCWAFS